MISFLPTILVHSKEGFMNRLELIQSLRGDVSVSAFQIDVIDGEFVDAPETYVTPDVIGALPEDDQFPFEVDLMVQDPLPLVGPWFDVGASRVFIHAEVLHNPGAVLEELHESGYTNVGLALNPETSLDMLPSAGQKDLLQSVLLMGVHPGASGQPFLEETVERVRSLRERYPDILIQVDGGVRPGTAGRLVAAGATHLAVGSFFETHTDGPLAALQLLKNDART